MLTVFEIAPERNGWTAPIILMWPMCEIARSPTATSKTGRCSAREAGRADDRRVLVDVRLDLLDLLVGVADRLQRHRDRAVDDRHLPAADELLELHEREVGLDAGRVAVHEERDRPGRREHRRLRVAVAVHLAELDGLLPRARGRRRAAPSSGIAPSGIAYEASRCIRMTALCGSRFSLVALVRAERRGDLRRLAVGAAGHQRRDRGGGRRGRRRSRTACRWT